MMKFSCEKALLQSAIAITSRAVAQKSSIPALEGLLLHADQELTVSGKNPGFILPDRYPYQSFRKRCGKRRHGPECPSIR